MSDWLPVFPLNTVLFPGVDLPLHVFEDRYRLLVRTLLELPREESRVFVIAALQEGYEVGAHGVQSVHRLGCSARLTSVEPYDDGRYDIEVVGERRVRVDALDSSGEYLSGQVTWLDDRVGGDAAGPVGRAAAAFDAYRALLRKLRGADALPGTVPSDPVALSYSLGATCLLTQEQRQRLLEADDAFDRLRLATGMMRAEMRAMRAVPSLPATQVARSGWSPN